MAAVLALWVASCASLYAQLKGEKTLDDILLSRVDGFADQPPLLQLNFVVLAATSFLLLLKVRGRGKRREPAAFVVNDISSPVSVTAAVLHLSAVYFASAIYCSAIPQHICSHHCCTI